MKYSIRKSVTPGHTPVQELSFSDSASISSLSLKRSSYSWPICLLPPVYSLITLIIMITIQSYNSPAQNPLGAQATLKMLQENLAHPPIEDILNFGFKQRNCPKDYQLAILGHWHGVNSGCICEDGQIKSRTYCLTHFEKNCKSVKYNPGWVFSKWKGKKYCIKYSKTWNWGECSANQVKCSTNICIPKNESCPISDLVQVQIEKFNTVTFGDNIYMKLNNGTSPLLNFHLTPGYETSPCLDIRYAPSFESKKYYPLSIQPEKGCDSYGSVNQYAQSLDSDYQLNVYEENQYAYFNNIAFFYNFIDSIDTYSLQVIKRVQINSNCSMMDSHNLRNIRIEGESIHSFTYYLSQYSIVVSIFMLITALLFYLLKNKVLYIQIIIFFKIKQWTYLDFKSFKFIEYQILFGLIIAALSIALGIVYFTQADGKQGLDGQNDIFEQYQNKNCFQDQGFQLAINQVIQFSRESFSDTEPYVKFAFYQGLGFTFMIAFLLILQFLEVHAFFIKPWDQ